MKKICRLLFISLFLLTASAKANEIVVLVPGFFNSFAPEYFGAEIVSSFAKKGFKVFIATGFNPIGSIEQNGAILENYLGQIQNQEGHHVDFNIVAHSAGGFYTLWTANRQKYSIKKLFTISTPFEGISFIQTWIENAGLFSGLTKYAFLHGFVQLTKAGVANFLSSIRVNPALKIIAFGGYQDEALDITNAENISWPLRITSHFIPTKSDGIVSYSSAMALGLIKTTESKPAQQFIVSNLVAKLEHWEQVLDSRVFTLLGVRNTSYIANEQRRFYSGVADLLLKN